MRGNPITWPGAALALASAILFGASTPIAKLLLGDGVSPWLLAGLLYLGSGIGLAFVHLGDPRAWRLVQGKRLFGVSICRGWGLLFSPVEWSARRC